MFVQMTTEEIFAEDWSAFQLTDEVKALGRRIAADMKKKLQNIDPDACRRFNKKTLLAVGMVFAQMHYHRQRFGLPQAIPVHSEMFMAITLAQPEFKSLKCDKFRQDCDAVADLLGLKGPRHE